MNTYSYPVFKLTNRCNTVCRYCFQNSTPNENQFLPKQTVFACLDYFLTKAEGKPFVLFTGGEIFLHPDIWEILEYAKGNGWTVRIQTNGLTIKDMTVDQLKFLSQKGVILKISLDGYNQATHEQMRAKGTFARIMAGIEAIKPYQPRFCVKSVLTPEVAREFQRMLDLSISIGAAGIAYNFLRPEGRATDLVNQVDEYEFTERAIELFNQKQYRHLLNGSDVLSIWMKKQNSWEERCFYINHNGKVYPCQDCRQNECIGDASADVKCLDENKLISQHWEVPSKLFQLVKTRLNIQGINPA